MELILNGANGNYLRNVLERSVNQVERVDAAVAYAADDRLLFEWCWTNQIPLRFWGRFDETIPVSIPVLQDFLSKGSGRYVCRLVRNFHPKAIWWRGYGAYIGSANLTQRAWWTNIEAGVILTEEELAQTGGDIALDAFFAKLQEHSSPLTQELFDHLSRRAAYLTRRRAAERERDAEFLATELVKHWRGLAQVSRTSASDRQRRAFLDEWNSTLQIIRDISSKISERENRPAWVSPNAPLGAQADQFLHAHYYQRTFDGQRADYENHFVRHRANPDQALQEAIRWWASLPAAPSEEDTMLNVRAPALQRAFSREQLPLLTEQEFIDSIAYVHAVADYARRVPNRLVKLEEGKPYTRKQKIEALGRRIYRTPERGGPSPLETLEFVLYSGPRSDVPQRLWAALTDPNRRIEGLGVSTLGEIVGWSMPNIFPPRNGRTSKALRSLGFDVRVHV